MRRVRPLTHRRLLRASRRAAHRRATPATFREARCALAESLSPLQIARRIDGESVVYRAHVDVSALTGEDDKSLASAFTGVILCAASGARNDQGPSLRPAVWTDRTGNMTVELRAGTDDVSAARVARVVEPILRGYAAGALEAARIVGGHEKVVMTVDASRTSLPEGGAVVRVVLHGRTSALTASAAPLPPSLDVQPATPTERLRPSPAAAQTGAPSAYA